MKPATTLLGHAGLRGSNETLARLILIGPSFVNSGCTEEGVLCVLKVSNRIAHDEDRNRVRFPKLEFRKL